MASYDIQPAISVNVGSNGEIASGNFTDMGLYLSLFGPDLYMKMNELNAQGSLCMGVGSLKVKIGNSFNTLNNANTKNNLYVYFYYSDGAAVNDSGTLPSFISEKLEVDESKIICFATNVTELSAVTSLKEGLCINRDSNLNIINPLAGLTYNWPIGQGTGQFNCFCVSLSDLTKLKNDSTKTDYIAPNPYYIGRCMGVETTDETPTPTSLYPTRTLSYIRNNVEGITSADELLIKFRDKVGYWVLNLLTGDLTAYKGTYAGYMTPWGSNMVKIGSLYYGLTTKENLTTNIDTKELYIFSYNPTTSEVKVGSNYVIGAYSINSGLFVYNNELYVQVNQGSLTSTSSSYKITYKKVNLSNLSVSSTTLNLTVPTYLNNGWRIDNYDEVNTYILHDTKNYNSFVFTNINDIEGSITKTLFVGCGLPLTFNSTNHIYVSNVIDGLYTSTQPYSSEGPYTLFRNTRYNGVKKCLCIEGATPLLTYTKFSKTYDKNENIDFTSSYYIQANRSN